jgi:hypothetical protein
MLAWALGLAPFKDVFWSTEEQPGNTYNKSEPNCELQALVSVLSCGGVGPGDKIGLANKELLLKTCRADGLLLKPDKPATTIDARFLPGGPKGEVWDTYVEFEGVRWRYLFVANQKEPFDLAPGEVGLSGDNPSIMLDCRTDLAKPVHAFAQTPLHLGGITVSKPAEIPFQLFLFAPLDVTGLAFLGESNKFIRVSKQRFKLISDMGKSVEVLGTPGEKVSLEWQSPARPVVLKFDGKADAFASHSNHITSSDGQYSVTFDAKQARLKVDVVIPKTGQVLLEIVSPTHGSPLTS